MTKSFWPLLLFAFLVTEAARAGAKICENERFYINTENVIFYNDHACPGGRLALLSTQALWDEAVRFTRKCHIKHSLWVASGSLGVWGDAEHDQWMLVPPPDRPQCTWPRIKPLNRNGHLSLNRDIARTLVALCMKH